MPGNTTAVGLAAVGATASEEALKAAAPTATATAMAAVGIRQDRPARRTWR